MLGTKKIVLRARQTGRPDLRHAKRLVQPVVDSIMKHEYSIVGLTALKDHDEYTYAHCVNVSVLSVSMGQALGLPRQALADLGVAALLHDIGKIAVPGDVLRKPAELDRRGVEADAAPPARGREDDVRACPGSRTLTLDSMRVCLEHHMNFDRTGYPEVAAEWGQATHVAHRRGRRLLRRDDRAPRLPQAAAHRVRGRCSTCSARRACSSTRRCCGRWCGRSGSTRRARCC